MERGCAILPDLMGKENTPPLMGREFISARAMALEQEYGPMFPDVQRAVDAALLAGDVRQALVTLDRWRFSHLSRADQLAEHTALEKNFKRAQEQGKIPLVLPDDLIDLIEKE